MILEAESALPAPAGALRRKPRRRRRGAPRRRGRRGRRDRGAGPQPARPLPLLPRRRGARRRGDAQVGRPGAALRAPTTSWRRPSSTTPTRCTSPGAARRRRSSPRRARREVTPGDRSALWIACARSAIAFDLGRWDEAEEVLPPRNAAQSGRPWPTCCCSGRASQLGRGDTVAARKTIEHARDLFRRLGRAPVHRPGRGAGGRTGAARGPRSTRPATRRRKRSTSSSSAATTRRGWRMISAAATMVEAEAAERARDLGDAAELEASLARAELMAARTAAAAEEIGRQARVRLPRSTPRPTWRGRGATPTPPARAAAAAAAWDDARSVPTWRRGRGGARPKRSPRRASARRRPRRRRGRWRPPRSWDRSGWRARSRASSRGRGYPRPAPSPRAATEPRARRRPRRRDGDGQRRRPLRPHPARAPGPGGARRRRDQPRDRRLSSSWRRRPPASTSPGSSPSSASAAAPRRPRSPTGSPSTRRLAGPLPLFTCAAHAGIRNSCSRR